MRHLSGVILVAFLAVTPAAPLNAPVAAFGIDTLPQSRQVVLTIKGMMCASCGQEVEKVLKKVVGVGAVQVDVVHDRATVTYDERKVTPRQMVEAIRKAGYDASLPTEAKPAAR